MEHLTSKQIAEWEVYDRLDPIGTWRDDFRMAYICSVISNLTISVHGKKGTKQTAPKDFMPEWGVDPKAATQEQSVEEMKAFLLGMAKTVKGLKVTQGNPKKPLKDTK